MQLRTILARDMREALARMRAEMGEDAVIVGSQKARDGGVIVRVALDHPEESESAAVPQSAPAATEQDNAAPSTLEDTHRSALMRRLRGERSANATARNFNRAELLSLLRTHRAPESLAHDLAKAAEQSGLSDMTLALASALDRRMNLAPVEFTRPVVLLLVGPNGAGKTAVAAKLAAHAKLAGRAVKLVATDADGAGAIARLETFARHLDVPFAVVESAEDLAKTVAQCRTDNTSLIIDTAGFDPRNGKARAAFTALSKIEGIETVGIVSAASDAEEVSEITGALGTLGAKSLIVTSVDTVRRLGALVAAASGGPTLAHVTRSAYVAAGLETLTPLSLARVLIDSGSGDSNQGSAQ